MTVDHHAWRWSDAPLAATSALSVVWDAVAIDTIPSDAQNILAYQSTLAAVKARWPNAKKIPLISTTGGLDQLHYDGVDSENGDATPAIAAQWAMEKIRAGLGRPWIYIEIANRHLVVAELAKLGLAFGPAPVGEVDCWLAWWQWDPTPPTFIPTGIYRGWDTGIGNTAWQYYNESKCTFDKSVAYSDWLSPPVPVPPEVEMLNAIQIVATPRFPKGGTFLDAGTVWIGPLDELSVIELKDNKVDIFQSKTNSIFNAKDVIPYPPPPTATDTTPTSV